MLKFSFCNRYEISLFQGAENINNLKKFATKASPVPTTQDGEQANDDDEEDDDDDVPGKEFDTY